MTRRFSCAALALLALGSPAGAAGPRVRIESARVGARLDPVGAKLGERVTYHGVVEGGNGARVRFIQPRDEGALHWGPLVFETRGTTQWVPGKQKASPAGWTQVGGGNAARVEAPLQVFALGSVAVPGIEFEMDEAGKVTRHRLPVTHLVVAPVVAANDTAADFRRLRGPLAAPWWERVPWRWVLVGFLVLAAIAVLVWMRMRRKRVSPVLAPVAPARPRMDAVTEALRDLAALRRLGLPAEGKFAEHAFQLTRILRRFFEATAGVSRPGDTTPELVRHLALGALNPEELKQVEGLLRVWDRVKFARAPSTRDEAERAEAAVEALVRSRALAITGKAA